MKQAVMTAPGAITIQDVPKVEAGPGEVLVEMKRIGVCGSDIHVFHGLHPYTSYPIVQGHEVSGVIASLGEGVTGLDVGDTVTFMPQVTCGECYPCQHGMYHICETLKVMGFQTNGAAQEYFAVPADLILKLPEGFSLDQAAMIEPVAVGVHSVLRGLKASTFDDLAGKNVLVLGAGTIGNLVAQVAKGMGAAKVIITDISAYKLEKAKACGIDCAINTTEENLEEAILREFGPNRADLILECVGVEPTMTQAIDYARKGTTIVVVGVFGEKPRVDLGLVQDRELSLVGTLMYQDVDYHKAIELATAGKLCLEPMVTARYKFDDYLDAYHDIESSDGHYLKVMIDLD